MLALDGTTLAKTKGVRVDDFVQEKVFDRDPDKEDYQGYMGNWGPEATHFYHDSVPHHSSNLSEQPLNLDLGRSSGVFYISQALASTGG